MYDFHNCTKLKSLFQFSKNVEASCIVLLLLHIWVTGKYVRAFAVGSILWKQSWQQIQKDEDVSYRTFLYGIIFLLLQKQVLQIWQLQITPVYYLRIFFFPKISGENSFSLLFPSFLDTLHYFARGFLPLMSTQEISHTFLLKSHIPLSLELTQVSPKIVFQPQVALG